MADDDDKKIDARLPFLKDKIASGFPKLAATAGKIDKLLETEENKEFITIFFDDPHTRCLVVPESLKLDNVIPSKLGKTKVLVLVKLEEVAISKENMQTAIVQTELGGSSPFEHLELLANEVFLPVLSNPQNQAKWGEVPTREIMDKFHNFLSSTTILCGQIKGETRLPMPPIDLTGGPSTGKNKISLLEGAIITWTKQIRGVLKLDPESELKLDLWLKIPSISSNLLNGDVGCKIKISVIFGIVSSACNTGSKPEELSIEYFFGLIKGTSAEKDLAISAISSSSVDTITLSTLLLSRATLIDQYINGFELKGLIFFLGIPFDPPLAGMKAAKDIGL